MAQNGFEIRLSFALGSADDSLLLKVRPDALVGLLYEKAEVETGSRVKIRAQNSFDEWVNCPRESLITDYRRPFFIVDSHSDKELPRGVYPRCPMCLESFVGGKLYQIPCWFEHDICHECCGRHSHVQGLLPCPLERHGDRLLSPHNAVHTYQRSLLMEFLVQLPIDMSTTHPESEASEALREVFSNAVVEDAKDRNEKANSVLKSVCSPKYFEAQNAGHAAVLEQIGEIQEKLDALRKRVKETHQKVAAVHFKQALALQQHALQQKSHIRDLPLLAGLLDGGFLSEQMITNNKNHLTPFATCEALCTPFVFDTVPHPTAAFSLPGELVEQSKDLLQAATDALEVSFSGPANVYCALAGNVLTVSFDGGWQPDDVQDLPQDSSLPQFLVELHSIDEAAFTKLWQGPVPRCCLKARLCVQDGREYCVKVRRLLSSAMQSEFGISNKVLFGRGFWTSTFKAGNDAESILAVVCSADSAFRDELFKAEKDHLTDDFLRKIALLAFQNCRLGAIETMEGLKGTREAPYRKFWCDFTAKHVFEAIHACPSLREEVYRFVEARKEVFLSPLGKDLARIACLKGSAEDVMFLHGRLGRELLLAEHHSPEGLQCAFHFAVSNPDRAVWTYLYEQFPDAYRKLCFDVLLKLAIPKIRLDIALQVIGDDASDWAKFAILHAAETNNIPFLESLWEDGSCRAAFSRPINDSGDSLPKIAVTGNRPDVLRFCSDKCLIQGDIGFIQFCCTYGEDKADFLITLAKSEMRGLFTRELVAGLKITPTRREFLTAEFPGIFE